MSAPILFLFFNRTDVSVKVFERIRRHRPSDLFLASDGPRLGKPQEAAAVAELRTTILGMIDWECNVRTLFRDGNLGCRKAVSSAIDWFFENVEEGIILEDDCLPDPTFFRFCDELLERYRDDKRVYCVSGDATSRFHSGEGNSYWFSPYPLIWGWATWRRAWQQYSVDIADDFRTNGAKVLADRFGWFSPEYHHWADQFEQIAQGRIDTWDYQWNWCVMKNAGLSCTANVNLISNIGFSEGATHTVVPNERAAYPEHPMEFPLVHPGRIEPHHAGARAIRDRLVSPSPRSILYHYARRLKRWIGR